MSLVGTTAIRIDFARRRVIKSRPLAIYATCMNVIFMALIPVTLHLAIDFWSGMSSNILLRLANSAFMCIYMLGSVLMMLFRRARDRRGTLRQLQRLATAQLRRISQTHWQLAGLVQQLCRSYLLQMLTVLLSFAVYTIFFGYVGVLVADGTISSALTVASGVVFLLSYSNLLADLYLFYRNCALTVAAHRRTADILRELHELPFASKELQRCSERFSWQLLERRLHNSMAGMFVLNLQTLLALWAFILRHTIILVQSDWENRLRLQRANAQ